MISVSEKILLGSINENENLIKIIITIDEIVGEYNTEKELTLNIL